MPQAQSLRSDREHLTPDSERTVDGMIRAALNPLRADLQRLCAAVDGFGDRMANAERGIGKLQQDSNFSEGALASIEAAIERGNTRLEAGFTKAISTHSRTCSRSGSPMIPRLSKKAVAAWVAVGLTLVGDIGIRAASALGARPAAAIAPSAGGK